jgi:hypothetical protein
MELTLNFLVPEGYQGNLPGIRLDCNDEFLPMGETVFEHRDLIQNRIEKMTEDELLKAYHNEHYSDFIKPILSRLQKQESFKTVVSEYIDYKKTVQKSKWCNNYTLESLILELLLKIEDIDYLKTIVDMDIERTYKCNALKRITDQEFLKARVFKDNCPWMECLNKITDEDFIFNILKKDFYKSFKVDIIRTHINKQEYLKDLVLTGSAEIRLEALKKINDADFIEKFLSTEKSKQVLLNTVESINNQEVLRKILLKKTTHDRIKEKIIKISCNINLLEEFSLQEQESLCNIEDSIKKIESFNSLNKIMKHYQTLKSTPNCPCSGKYDAIINTIVKKVKTLPNSSQFIGEE